nr:VOC family protein [uncultured Roseobacter sp.]
MDHFAIGADTLEQGVADMETKLGVTVPRGGKHDAMSTHNCVMQAGNESFFELIAIDPNAPADPGRVRWFTLDDPATQTRLKVRPRAPFAGLWAPTIWIALLPTALSILERSYCSPVASGHGV